MLKHLHIEHFALIDDLDTSFDNGMNVIIGETGAGKSILMNAINLLLGSRSDFDKIRVGEEKAFIEGEFILSPYSYNLLKNDYEDYLEGDTLIISRSLDIKGKSIQRINSRIVPLSIIRQISSLLIDIHSPKEELFFYDEKKQTNILDNYLLKKATINEQKLFQDYDLLYKSYMEIQNKIKDINDLLSKQDDKEYLEYEYNELNEANIEENELEDLENKYASLSSLMSITTKLESFFSNVDNGLKYLFNAKRDLDSLNEETFNDEKEKFNDLYYNLEDVNDSMKEKFEDLLSSSSKIEEIKSRLFFLRSLKRKYGGSTKEILEKKEEIKTILNSFENASYEINKYNNELIIKEEELNNLAASILSVRKKYALELEKDIDTELKDLLFDNAQFKIEFIPTILNKNGNYRAHFLFRANQGMNALDLKESISLGESSRLLLAFKKVFFDYIHQDTLIFDEIDIGLSSKAALAIGRKIKEISTKAQVLIISHLGQVAINFDSCYLVKKEIKNDITSSNIYPLNNEEALIEISKMVNNGTSDESSLNLVKSWLE